MCLGIPGQVVRQIDESNGWLVVVDVQGAEREVNAGMLDQPPLPGEWVLLHLGFAVEVIDEAGAGRALDGLRLMGRGARPGDAP
ncbi:MAG TPA: HypC/HybG/HupF family hydrogenase formation chaperone [Jatrophihabitantaceae bacterium]|jgi:hydrogenase assembly chaperone HypC/HupF|nr:HypC/HybG/HupF family hydrogenase formation chaperone [Jatrophihabitantaceae bacterium]